MLNFWMFNLVVRKETARLEKVKFKEQKENICNLYVYQNYGNIFSAGLRSERLKTS